MSPILNQQNTAPTTTTTTDDDYRHHYNYNYYNYYKLQLLSISQSKHNPANFVQWRSEEVEGADRPGGN